MRVAVVLWSLLLSELWTAVGGFATAGEANGCTSQVTRVTANSTTSALVEYADCSKELVQVTATSNGKTQLSLRSRQIVSVESLPVVNVLDLSNNSLSRLENVSIPSTVQTLDLSRNPFSSMQSFEFPTSLNKLTSASGALSSLQNFSFPDSILTLNFSSNPVTQISGVSFPSSLKILFLTSTVGLQELEVRQTDAALFESLEVFNVSTVQDVTCKDPAAMIHVVQETLLCVLTDEHFDTKYRGQTDKNSSGSTGVTITLAPELKSSITQRRTKFLILSAVSLGLAFVALLVLLVMRNTYDRVERGRRARQPNIYRPVLPSKRPFWEEG